MVETRLFVGNIPLNTSEQDLQAEFGHYGYVNSVEIKSKNEDEKFAFVNLQIEERLVEKCKNCTTGQLDTVLTRYILLGIREFGQQQFKGNYLSVSRAKESFLERLKREREESQRPKVSPATSASRHQDETYTDRYQPLPTIDKEVSSDESSEEEEEIPQAPVKKLQYKPDAGGFAVSFKMH